MFVEHFSTESISAIDWLIYFLYFIIYLTLSVIETLEDSRFRMETASFIQLTISSTFIKFSLFDVNEK